MEITSHHSLVRLPVETKSGDYLGRISHVEIDPNSDLIIRYHVKPSWFMRLWARSYIIHKTQVVKITPEKMIVEDNVVGLKLRVLPRTKLVDQPAK